MYGCESWAIKKAEHRRIDNFCAVMLEKTLESPLDCKEIQPVHPAAAAATKEIQLVHPKGDQSWVFFGRTDVEAETPILGPPHAKC